MYLRHVEARLLNVSGEGLTIAPDLVALPDRRSVVFGYGRHAEAAAAWMAGHRQDVDGHAD